jgi:hypothetical protein
VNCDEFSVLFANVPLREYERIRASRQDPTVRQAFALIAATLDELGTYVRFIAVELAMEAPAVGADPARALAPLEIKRLVQKWIGVSSGYLGDFSYGSHQEFYVDIGLPIDPAQYEGTTRSRFMQILGESAPDVQSKILEGILTKYPVGSAVPAGSGAARTPEMLEEIRAWISRPRGTAVVVPPVLGVTSAVVERAPELAGEALQRRASDRSASRRLGDGHAGRHERPVRHRRTFRCSAARSLDEGGQHG